MRQSKTIGANILVASIIAMILCLAGLSGCAITDAIGSIFGNNNTANTSEPTQESLNKNDSSVFVGGTRSTENASTASSASNNSQSGVQYVSTKDLPPGTDQMPLPWYRAKLTPEEQQLYDTIENGVRSMSLRIDVPTTNYEALSKCYQFVLDDNPDIFWVGMDYTYISNGLGAIVALEPSYDNPEPLSVSERNDLIGDKIKDMLAAADPNWDDYHKALYIFTWICDHTVYDVNAQENQDIESVFLYGRSSCAGYSKAFQYLATKLGLASIYVTGMASSDGNNVEHAWNAVCLNGTIVYLDTTWGDRDGEAPTDYGWLALTDGDINRSHTPSMPEILPPAPSWSYELWSVAGGFFGEYNEEAIYQRLSDGVASREACTSIRLGYRELADQVFTELTASPKTAGRLAAEFPDAFPEASTRGVYAVYRDEELDAIVFVWQY